MKFKRIELKPLEKEKKFKFFKCYMQIAGKENLVDFEAIKNHQIFDKLDTFILEKIINQMDEEHDLDYYLHMYDKSGKLIKNNKLAIKNYCANLLESIPQESYPEKNLILFLTITPAGLSEIEIR